MASFYTRSPGIGLPSPEVAARVRRSVTIMRMSQGLLAVFGGTGFLGRRIVRQALNTGWTVRMAARRRRPDLFAGEVPEPEHVEVDIRDPEMVAAAVKGATAVVNSVGLYVEDRRDSFETIHVIGAGHVAQASKRAEARLVHVSGIGVDRRAGSDYVRARALGEERVRDAYIDSVILRPSVLFGPGDSLVSTLSSMVRWLPVIPLFGDGDTRLQPVHVDDVARAVLSALELREACGGVFELGGPDVLTYRELVQAIGTATGRRRWLQPVPFGVWKLLAALCAVLPAAPITRDQIELLQRDNVVTADTGFASLGIGAASLTRVVDAVPHAMGRAAGQRS